MHVGVSFGVGFRGCTFAGRDELPSGGLRQVWLWCEGGATGERQTRCSVIGESKAM